MNAKYGLGVGVAVMTLSSLACGYGIKTSTDYDHNVNFSRYRSFAIMKGNSSGNPLTDQRAMAAVASVLASRGWKEAPAGEAQTTVVVHAATKTKHTYETFYDGWGGWRWRWGSFGPTQTFINDYKVGTLVVDMFDAKTKALIWRGSSSDTLSSKSDANIKNLDKGVKKMFDHFPPEPKK